MVDLHNLCLKFLEQFPSKISTEQTELLSNYDNVERETPFEQAMVTRLFSLLRIIDNVENVFLTNKQILTIRDTLKEKNIDLKDAPVYINNIRMRFNKAQQKLARILKFSSKNFFKDSTHSNEMNSSLLYAPLQFVDYSPSGAHSGVDKIEFAANFSNDQGSFNKGKMSVMPRKTERVGGSVFSK